MISTAITERLNPSGDRTRSVAIALIETEQLDTRGHIADRVLPCVSQRTNAFIAEKIDEPGHGG
jgi:hypothetical protein